MIYRINDGKDASLASDGSLENVTLSETVNVLDNVLGITDVVETSTSKVTLPEVKVPKEVDTIVSTNVEISISWLKEDKMQ